MIYRCVKHQLRTMPNHGIVHARLWDESGFLVQFNVDATPLNIMGHTPTLA